MLAHYGYRDGSGEFFIVIDSDRCTGCGECVEACPAGVFALVDDEFSLDVEGPMAAVSSEHRTRIRYSCAPCKPTSGYETADLPCVRSCEPGAIDHSW